MTTIEARITEALMGHWSASTHTDKKPFVDKCDGCGEVILTWGGEGDAHGVDGSTRLAAHQAVVVAGIVTEACAAAVIQNPALVIHTTGDPESHARSFNEGYETATAQGLADDPALAQDWLDDKIREAQAEALRDTADDYSVNLTAMSGPRIRHWLQARADQINPT